MIYRHKVIDLNNILASDLQKKLDELGKDGFKIVACTGHFLILQSELYLT